MNNQLLIIIVIIVALYIIQNISNKKIVEEKFSMLSLTPEQLNEIKSLCQSGKDSYMYFRNYIGSDHDFSIKQVRMLCR
jgi:hypothetical protein